MAPPTPTSHSTNDMKLYTYAGNVHALQTMIAARYNGVDIELPAFEMGKDNKSAAFLAKSPMGKVPLLETSEGCISEAAAIARYVARIRADTNMYGASFFEAGLVDQWVEFAKNELVMPVGAQLIYAVLASAPAPALGLTLTLALILTLTLALNPNPNQACGCTRSSASSSRTRPTRSALRRTSSVASPCCRLGFWLGLGWGRGRVGVSEGRGQG